MLETCVRFYQFRTIVLKHGVFMKNRMITVLSEIYKIN
jgi:hypothetical protein